MIALIILTLNYQICGRDPAPGATRAVLSGSRSLIGQSGTHLRYLSPARVRISVGPLSVGTQVHAGREKIGWRVVLASKQHL